MLRKGKWDYLVFILLSFLVVSCEVFDTARPSTNKSTITPSNTPTIALSTEATDSVSVFEIGDGGLFSEKSSCKPPCLLGITPGITHESEIWSILESKKLSNRCRVWDNGRESGTRGIECIWSKGSIAIGLAYQEDAVRSLGFTPSETIRIDQVLEKYGTPSWVAVWEGGIPEYPTIGITIFYDETKTLLHFIDQDGSVYEMRPDAEIIDVLYLSAQEYDYFIQEIKDTLYDWEGYGEYQIH